MLKPNPRHDGVRRGSSGRWWGHEDGVEVRVESGSLWRRPQGALSPLPPGEDTVRRCRLRTRKQVLTAETLLAPSSWTCSLQSREESVSVVHEQPGLFRVSAQSLPGLCLVSPGFLLGFWCSITAAWGEEVHALPTAPCPVFLRWASQTFCPQPAAETQPAACMSGDMGYIGISGPSSQLFCKPKIALKLKNITL